MAEVDLKGSRKFLRTSDIAGEIGLHPNTIRLYEEWGFLPPIPRGENNYRLFSQEHLDQMRLAHLLLQWPYPGGKKPVASLVRQAVQGDLGVARGFRYHHSYVER